MIARRGGNNAAEQHLRRVNVARRARSRVNTTSGNIIAWATDRWMSQSTSGKLNLTLGLVRQAKRRFVIGDVTLTCLRSDFTLSNSTLQAS